MTDTNGPTSDRPRWRGRLLRIGVSVALLALLTSMVDWPQMSRLVRDARWEFIAAAVLCVLAARVAITWRWKVFLARIGSRPAFASLFRIVSGSMAFAAVLPSSFGADVARGTFLGIGMAGGRNVKPSEVVASLVLDRYAATLGTLLVAALGAAAAGFPKVALGLCGAICVIVAATYAILRGSSAAIQLLTPGPLRRLRPKIDALMLLIRRPGMIVHGVLPGIAWSMLVTLFRTCVFICLYYALGQSLPVGLAFFAIPVMLIALMIPVTVGGFGVREWLLVLSFETAGIMAEVSIAVGILSFAIQTLVSLPPLLMLFLSRAEHTDFKARSQTGESSR